MWPRVPRANLQGQMCRITACLFPPHSFLLPFTCELGWGKGLGPTQLQLCHYTLHSVVLSSSPDVDGLFCSLWVIFRISSICCSCLLGVYVGRSFHLAALLHHFFQKLFQTELFVLLFKSKLWTTNIHACPFHEQNGGFLQMQFCCYYEN